MSAGVVYCPVKISLQNSVFGCCFTSLHLSFTDVSQFIFPSSHVITIMSHPNPRIHASFWIQTLLVSFITRRFNISGHADGSCEQTQYINIRFNSSMGLLNSSLIIYFKQRNDSFQISNFTLAVYFEQKLNATEARHMYLMDEHAELDGSTNINEAYKCSELILSFGNGTAVNLHNIRLTAYAHLNTTEFPGNQEYDICQLDVRTSDLVPIVVGICLAALVIIVLIAYLVGRARAKRQGYASV
ncbi:BMA-LMP-1, isoform b [Dirofilaria immitis]|nr:BMA-LMP-1, isoform b [Dirofilaria immitis]